MTGYSVLFLPLLDNNKSGGFLRFPYARLFVL